MQKRTKNQIETEIKLLEACKSYIPKCSLFGDDNYRKIDLQIEELRIGIDDTAEDWESYSEGEQSAILEARDWAEGQIEESISSGWDNFKPAAPSDSKP